MPTPTLDSLEAALLEVDRDFGADDQLNGLSFHKTLHNTLGFANPRDFSVFLPWKEWSQDLAFTVDVADVKKLPSNSVLQEAFKDVLSQGASKDKCFIDLAHLWDGNEIPFFAQGDSTSTDDATKSVPKAIADLISQVEGDQKRIVVRFLIGDPNMVIADDKAKKLVQDMFWEENGTPLVKKQNAKLYLGLYSPNYDLNTDEKPLDLIRSQAGNIRALAAFLETNLKIDVSELEKLATRMSSLDKTTALKYLDEKMVSLSWNHGKIVAVNGTSLLTGGANFAWESASGKYMIVEQSCKIKGDVAVSAHVWQDYFFNYLSKRHPSDHRSFLTSINLGDPNKEWKTHGDKEVDDAAYDPAPKSKDPHFDIKSTAEKGVKVLSIAQLGDWHGGASELDYPVQIVQLIKDLVSNIVWSALAKTDALVANEKLREKITHFPVRGVAAAIVDMFFTEQKASRDALGKALKLNVPNPYQKLRINPNAWASRTTRLNAIANATKNVVVCQQRLILPPVPEQKSAVATINKELKLEEDRHWDGVMWPYDLMIAICYAILPSNRDPGWVDVSDNDSAHVSIVLSNFHISTEADGGWGDEMDFGEFKRRLKMVMRGIVFLATLPSIVQDFAPHLPKGEGVPQITPEQATNLSAAAHLFSKGLDFSLTKVETVSRKVAEMAVGLGSSGSDLFTEFDYLVDRKVHLRRVLKDHTQDHPPGATLPPNEKIWTIACHCKVVCVDDALLYIGSDNAYPSYNEEHGVWIEDRDTIKEWKNKFWNPLWESRAIE